MEPDQPQPNSNVPSVSSPTSPVISSEPTPQSSGPVGPNPVNQKQPRSKKPIFIGIAAAVLVVIASAGFVFGYYLPNQPDNVWRTGMERTASALEEMINKSTTKEKLEGLKKSKVTGSFTATGDGFDVSGEIGSKFDITKSNSSLSIDLKSDQALNESGTKELNLDASLVSSLAEGKRFPDIFFKLSGFQEVGLIDYFAPDLGEYDDKWISVSSDYLESTIGKYYDEGEQYELSPNTQLSVDEASALIRAVNSSLKEHVFTSDESKSIIVKKEYVGKETLGDIKAHHYKAGVNLENARALCTSVVTNVFAVQGVEKLFDGDTEAKDKARDSALESCQEEIDDESRQKAENYSFDVWIDTKYKLLHKIRLPQDDGGYVDIGQNYAGGDDVTLFIEYSGNDTKARMEITSNLETLKSTMAIDATFSESNKLEVDITIEPLDEEIDVSRPDGAVELEEILQKLQAAQQQAFTAPYGQIESDL